MMISGNSLAAALALYSGDGDDQGPQRSAFRDDRGLDPRKPAAYKPVAVCKMNLRSGDEPIANAAKGTQRFKSSSMTPERLV
jgi:hypothetical protein